MRTAVIFFSAFIVLLCPYECAVRHAFARGAEDRMQVPCCEHCEARMTTEAAQDRAPAAPVSDDDNLPCFCEGAVFDAAGQAVVDESLDLG